MLIYHSLPMLHWRSSSSTFKSIFGCFKGVKSAKKSKKKYGPHAFESNGIYFLKLVIAFESNYFKVQKVQKVQKK